MTREICRRFNNQYGEILVMPEPDILEDVATRQRRRFDSLAALQAWLQDLFTISKQ